MDDWRVFFNADEIDVKRISRLPRLEIQAGREPGSWSITSAGIQAAPDASSARQIARALLDDLHLAACFADRGAGPFKIGHVERKSPDAPGITEKYAFAEAVLRARSELSVLKISADGTQEKFEPEPDLIPIYSAVTEWPDAREAFRFWREGTWASLSKAIEVIEHAVGGEKTLEAKEWVPGQELKRLSHTANNVNAVGEDARHFRRQHPPPKIPMTIEEARALVR